MAYSGASSEILTMNLFGRNQSAVFWIAVIVLPVWFLAQILPHPSSAQSQPQIDAGSFSGSDTDLSSAQLESLVGRIALYPDDLLAVVLPASTQPLQVVQAQRLLDRRKSDPSVQPPKSWDPSVVALLNYPEVISLMNSDLTWTQQLGTSVVNH